MKPIEKKCFLCPQNKFGKCLFLPKTHRIKKYTLQFCSVYYISILALSVSFSRVLLVYAHGMQRREIAT